MAFYHPLTCIYGMYQRVLKNYSQVIAPAATLHFLLCPLTIKKTGSLMASDIRVPGGIRTPDLPLRSGRSILAFKVS